jgi:hypothetical protein
MKEGTVENLRIYDMKGRLILSRRKIDNNSVYIGSLPKGVYMMVAFNGIKNIQGKFIKF